MKIMMVLRLLIVLFAIGSVNLSYSHGDSKGISCEGFYSITKEIMQLKYPEARVSTVLGQTGMLKALGKTCVRGKLQPNGMCLFKTDESFFGYGAEPAVNVRVNGGVNGGNGGVNGVNGGNGGNGGDDGIIESKRYTGNCSHVTVAKID